MKKTVSIILAAIMAIPALAGDKLPGIWDFTVGTPEAITPTSTRRFQPKAAKGNVRQCPVTVNAVQKGDTAWFRIPVGADEDFYGLGLQMTTYRLNGLRKTLRVNADPKNIDGDSHAPVPFYLSTAGYGIFVDTGRYATFDFTNPSEVVICVPRCTGATLKVFGGPTLGQALARYNLYSGGGCVPPDWGLGFWYRVEKTFNDKATLAMINDFRERNIPLSVVGLEPGWQTHAYSCSYVWSQRFPDPKAFVDSCDRLGVKVNLWEHAFVHPSSPIHKDMVPYSGDKPVWSGLVPDFTLPEARRIFSTWHHDALTGIGISGFKADECDGSDFNRINWSFPMSTRFPSGADGEQMHSLLGLRYMDALLDAMSGTPTYNLVRSAGAFAAPYPFVLYSDLYDHRTFINSVAQASLGGLLWCPEVRHASCPEELLLRMQSVVLSPLAMINAYYLNHQPWKQVNKDLNNKGVFAPGWEKVEDRCRELINIRMELLPAIKKAFEGYAAKGIPPFRALVIDWPEDPAVRDIAGQWMIGDRLMAAPPAYGDKLVRVYFPGKNAKWQVWGDSSKVYRGGTWATFPVSSDMLYLFQRVK